MADEARPLALGQPIERHQRDVRVPRPRRLKIGPERDDEKDRQRLQAFDRQRQEFDRGRIGPMDILEQHQHRTVPRQSFELLDQRREQAAALALWISRLCRRSIRQSQQFRE